MATALRVETRLLSNQHLLRKGMWKFAPLAGHNVIRRWMMCYRIIRFAACFVIGLTLCPAQAAVLCDINADGTNRNGSTADFESAIGLDAGAFSGETVNTFPNSNPSAGPFSQTVNNITLQVSKITGDADGWFGAGSDNNLLEDGLYHRDTVADPTAVITLSGSGLGLAANRRYALYLFASRSQGHETTFTFDVNHPEEPSGGAAIHTDPPVVGGDNTLGTALFTFETGSIVPSSLVITWDGAQNVNGNQDAVFAGFALRENFETVAYWQLDETSGDLADAVALEGDQTLSGQSGLTYSQAIISPDPVPNPETEPFISGTATGNVSSIDFSGLTLAPKATNAAPFKITSTSSFTLEGWLRHNISNGSQSGLEYIAGDRHNTTGYKGWHIVVYDGKAQVYCEGTTIQGITDIDDGSPHHFAVVWDHAEGEIRLYVDGNPEDVQTVTPVSYSQSAFSVGARCVATDGLYNDNRLNGRLDELRFSRVALSSQGFLSAPPPDTEPPQILSFFPTNSAVNVSPDVHLIATFDEFVAANTTGSIVISNRSDHSIRTINIDDESQVFFSGNSLKINPAENLARHTPYAVLIETNALKDLEGNFFSGITNGTTWAFETGKVHPLLQIGHDGTSDDEENPFDSFVLDGGADWAYTTDGSRSIMTALDNATSGNNRLIVIQTDGVTEFQTGYPPADKGWVFEIEFEILQGEASAAGTPFAMFGVRSENEAGKSAWIGLSNDGGTNDLGRIGFVEGGSAQFYAGSTEDLDVDTLIGDGKYHNFKIHKYDNGGTTTVDVFMDGSLVLSRDYAALVDDGITADIQGFVSGTPVPLCEVNIDYVDFKLFYSLAPSDPWLPPQGTVILIR